MNYADIRKVIESHFDANWDSVTYPVAWDNVQFNTPSDAWVRITISYVGANNSSLGDLATQKIGIVAVQIFTPADLGTGEAYQMADLVTQVLQNKLLNGTTGKIYTYATSIQVIGDAIRKINKIEYGEYQIVCKTRFIAH